MPKIIAITGLAAGQVYELRGDETVIGRDAANEIAIPDQSLSRKHCVVSRVGGGWTVRDLGSVNGTRVNGARVTERSLKDGDHIGLGKTELLVRLESEPRAEEPRPPEDATVNLKLEDALYLQCSSELPEVARVQRDLQALVRIGSALAWVGERDRLEEQLLDAAMEIVPATSGVFVRIDEIDGSTEVTCTRYRQDGPASAPSSTVLHDAISKKIAILSNNAAGEPSLRGAKSVLDAGITSVLAVPLIDRSRAIGALYLTTRDRETTFDRLHLEVLTALAGIGSAALANADRLASLEAESRRLQQQLRLSHDMVGEAESMRRVYAAITKAAPTDLTVLITGETGTGKELVARALHVNSRRAAWPFVTVNCATLGEHLLESELFGHERGAFTGAVNTKRGKFELADRGTIFLDEIGELPLPLQAKLLRALQEREIERVGGTRPIKIDVRVIAATNRDLQEEVKTGRFRMDLYYRLDAFCVTLPALRERREDIRLLARHFVAAAARGRTAVRIAPEAMQRLLAHDWPGNVRELQNVIERALVLSNGAEIVPEDLPPGLGERGAVEPDASRFHGAVDEAKRRVILEALADTDGVVTDAARLLGLHPNYLHRLINTLGLRLKVRAGSDNSGAR